MPSLFPKMLLALFCVILSSCAPRQTQDTLVSINLIDRDGISETITSKERLKKYAVADFLSSQPYQKVLRVYKRKPNGDIPAYVTSYHPNGQLHQYLEIINGRALGPYNEWYPNGQQKIEAFVIGGEADITVAAEKSWLFDGICQVWDEQGNLLAEIPYDKGVLEGTSIYYHPDGNIAKTTPFTKGQIHGTHSAYLPAGALLLTAEYKDNVQDGISLQYRPNGEISAEEIYCEGLLMNGRYIDACNQIVSEIQEGNGYRSVFQGDFLLELQEFHHGVPEGEVKTFNSRGQPVRIWHVKNGLKQGEEIEYYVTPKKIDKPIPKISINWFDNKIQGVVKTWYPNGVQESQREMSQNTKNGIATAWYLDGSLMLIEEYDRNKLIRGEYYRKGEKQPVSMIIKGKGLATLFDADGNFVRKVNYIGGMPLD